MKTGVGECVFIIYLLNEFSSMKM